MSPNAPACRSFVFFSLILCAMLYAFPLVHGITVDDEPDNANVNWHGEWFQYYNITSAMDETLTLGNRSKEGVTFTFTGTSIQVYGVLKPVGTWDIRSQYTIDDGDPIVFTHLSEVSKHTFGVEFFDSGTLRAGNHTLTVTNLGVYLWLDYFQFDNDVNTSPDSTSSVIPPSTIQSSSTKIVISSASSSHKDNHSGVMASSTTALSASSQVSTVMRTTASTPFSEVPPASPSLPLSSPLPVSLPNSASSSSISTSPQGVETPGVHTNGISHGTVVGLTVATVVGVVLLALLLLLCHRRRSQRKNRSRTSLSSKIPIARDSLTLSTSPSTMCNTSPQAADVVCSFSDWLYMAAGRRSKDGGVSVAGGPGISNANAPSISDAESEKSTLPPSYKDYDAV